MKKLKVVLAIALAVVLLITILNVPTFSWFTRPQPNAQTTDETLGKGQEMVLQSKNQYNAFNGYNVTFSTKKSTDGVNYTPVTNSDADLDGVDLPGRCRNYFCTTIKNSSGSTQNVSLYATKLSIPTAATNGTLAIGVNGPTRNYRDYSDLTKKDFTTAKTNTMRVYFEKDNSVTGWNGTNFYVCWKEAGEVLNESGSNGHYYQMFWVGDDGSPNHYYADIPRTANQLFFAVANWGTNGTNGAANKRQRSQTMTNLSSDKQKWDTPQLWKITKESSGDYSRADRQTSYIGGATIDKYYSSISVAAGGNTFPASLQSGWYKGGSVEYYSSDESLFTVNNGTITTKGKTGEAKLFTKVVNSGVFWDAFQVETTIKVTEAGYYEFNDVPIVRNLLIPAKNEVNVYWYVINNHDTNSLNYDINGLYLGM